MRTLSKPIKPKQIHQKKDTSDKKDPKSIAKKLMKTVFHSPFRYRMYNSIHLAKLYPFKIANK